MNNLRRTAALMAVVFAAGSCGPGTRAGSRAPRLQASSLVADDGLKGPAPHASLTEREKGAVIDRLADSLKARYVHPDLATQVGRKLTDERRLGSYDRINDPVAFAKLVTGLMRAVSRDVWLEVAYDGSPLAGATPVAHPVGEGSADDRRRARLANAGFDRVERLEGNIGYISIRSFLDPKAAARPLRAAMDFVADTDALILDMRDNGGGKPETVRLLCSYFLPPKSPSLEAMGAPVGGRAGRPGALGKVDGRRYLGRDVYVLTGTGTLSGAEELCYLLKNLRGATIVGDTTGSPGVVGDVVRLGHRFEAFIPTRPNAAAAAKARWDGKAIEPDVQAPENTALTVAHLEALRRLLAPTKDPSDRERLLAAIQDVQAIAGVPQTARTAPIAG